MVTFVLFVAAKRDADRQTGRHTDKQTNRGSQGERGGGGRERERERLTD